VLIGSFLLIREKTETGERENEERREKAPPGMPAGWDGNQNGGDY
jgi:hypothetical protein